MDVRVKPLVWGPSVINKPWHSAKAPWGYYYAQWDEETQAWFASLEMGEVEAPIILSPSDVSTLGAAKAAAQADYEARILAAAPDLMAELVEAASDLLAAVCGETGFASAVRADSGLAYPWPALDAAEKRLAAALAKIKEPT